MAPILVLTPGTNVEIVPFTGCDNSTGIIIETKLRRCCESATNMYCLEYLVRYQFQACTSCSYQETWFCSQDIVEIP